MSEWAVNAYLPEFSKEDPLVLSFMTSRYTAIQWTLNLLVNVAVGGFAFVTRKDDLDPVYEETVQQAYNASLTCPNDAVVVDACAVAAGTAVAPDEEAAIMVSEYDMGRAILSLRLAVGFGVVFLAAAWLTGLRHFKPRGALHPRPAGKSLVALGFGQVWGTARMLRGSYPNTFWFLIAYMLYVSGIASTTSLGALYLVDSAKVTSFGINARPRSRRSRRPCVQIE